MLKAPKAGTDLKHWQGLRTGPLITNRGAHSAAFANRALLAPCHWRWLPRGSACRLGALDRLALRPILASESNAAMKDIRL